MTPSLKRIIAYLAIGAILLIAGYAVINAWQMRGEAKVYLAQLKAQEKAAALLAKKSEAEREALTAEIAERDNVVASLTHDLGTAETEIKELTGKISDLETVYPTLTTCESRLANMTDQRDKWKSAFTLAAAEHDGYEDIIEQLHAKYTAQVKISATWQAQYEAEHATRQTADKAISALKLDLRKARLIGVVKTAGAIALAGIVVYQLLPKGK